MTPRDEGAYRWCSPSRKRKRTLKAAWFTDEYGTRPVVRQPDRHGRVPKRSRPPTAGDPIPGNGPRHRVELGPHRPLLPGRFGRPGRGVCHPGALPGARRLLRISFGVLWIIDGLLQTRSSIPLGLTSWASPSSGWWPPRVDGPGRLDWSGPDGGSWSGCSVRHSVGCLRTAAGSSGRRSPSCFVRWPVAWSPRLTDRGKHPDSDASTRGMCAFFVGMGVLEAWPGRRFWSGAPTGGGTQGNLVVMADQRSQPAQSSVVASWARDFGSFDASQAWAVNVVVLPPRIGTRFLPAQPKMVRVGVVVGAALGLGTPVMIPDFGVLGGVGTDPNSMVPMALVFFSGDLAIVRLPARADSATQGAVADAVADAIPEAIARESGPPRSRWTAELARLAAVASPCGTSPTCCPGLPPPVPSAWC
jgi:hypothetical protein